MISLSLFKKSISHKKTVYFFSTLEARAKKKNLNQRDFFCSDYI